MSFDLEYEVLRAAHALTTGPFTCAELRQRSLPRISQPHLAHLLDSLVETLVRAGLLARPSPGVYELTTRAIAELGREPAYLGATDR